MGPKVVIVGGGVIGLSIARSLAQRNVRDIVLLERSGLASAGTGKSSGIIRCHYGVASLAFMAWKSLPYFESARREVEFRQTGYVVGVGANNVESLEANIVVNQRLGIETEIIDPDEVTSLLPCANFDGLQAFAYEPRGGYADASQTALAFAREARACGVRIHQHADVIRLLTIDDRVTGVMLGRRTAIHSDIVIIAAGVWSAPLLAPLEIEFPVRAERSEVLIIGTGNALQEMSVFSDLDLLQYLRPDGPHTTLVGNSDHSAPQIADADNYSNRVSPEQLEPAVQKLLQRFPSLTDATIRTGYAGCYDVTPDYNPVIAAVGPKNLYLAAGFSGHGFKISPAVGELVTDLVLHGDSLDGLVPTRDFRLSRFDEGQPLLSAHPYAGAGQMR